MEAIDFTGPEQQARHLARYIKCPSTIRAHCLNDWGRSPKLDSIKAWQASFRRVAKKIEAPQDGDDLIPRLGSIPLPKLRQVSPPPPAAPTKRPVARSTPWPAWYSPPTKVFIASELIASVAKSFDLSSSALTGRGRSQRFVHARVVVIRIMRERGWSFPRIGQHLGGRDHTTIIHAAANYDIYARQSEQIEVVYQAHREAGWCG